MAVSGELSLMSWHALTSGESKSYSFRNAFLDDSVSRLL